MREIEETATRYICDDCGYKSSSKTRVEFCEARHICRHEKTDLRLNHGEDFTEMFEICSVCGEFVRDSRMEIQRPLSQKALFKIYEMLKNETGK